MSTFHSTWGGTNSRSRTKTAQVVRFKDASGAERFGVTISLRRDNAFVGVLPNWWLPETATHTPRHYQAMFVVPYTDIVESVASPEHRQPQQHLLQNAAQNAQKQA